MPRPTPPSDYALTSRQRRTMRHAAEFLRRGLPVLVHSTEASATILACETIRHDMPAWLQGRPSGDTVLAITGRRGIALGLIKSNRDVIRIAVRGELDAETITCLIDPSTDAHPGLDLSRLEVLPPHEIDRACIALAKSAGLLPAVLLRPPDQAAPEPALSINTVDILLDDGSVPLLMRNDTPVTIPEIGDARAIVFQALSDGVEHLVIVIGQIDTDQTVLTRLHSECLTGDLLGSLRCDCGEQLRGAIAEIARHGNGVLLYLAQEGRGIGLINKLRAYRLQDRGYDTIDANLQLGYEEDERSYVPAAQILGLLGIWHIRLMTNNPKKVDAVKRLGINVTEQVPHIFPSNRHNSAYLHTKAVRSGHLF